MKQERKCMKNLDTPKEEGTDLIRLIRSEHKRSLNLETGIKEKSRKKALIKFIPRQTNRPGMHPISFFLEQLAGLVQCSLVTAAVQLPVRE
ncbi:hypothetical protein K0M31_009007 [Melipona bicolor]|uniref:Uncharacterized protein n=1 Tax=Melipona bicolor TaxID=60889 RepID=A0AA40KJD1_9HYME|nr:hypothetical protein K0M31_009007 [Melipona bicolor]